MPRGKITYILACLYAAITVWASVRGDWKYALLFGLWLAVCVSGLVDRLSRFTVPLSLCVIGVFWLGGADSGCFHPIVGWALIAMAPVVALIDHIQRAKGKPLFGERGQDRTEITR